MTSPLEIEISSLKTELITMWMLVQSQINKAKEALLQFDKDLAREVLVKEKRVNAFELKIDRDCENILALHCPVAIDLRFLLATLKINSNLERIGDIAAGIARYVVDSSSNFENTAMEESAMISMYDEAINILMDTRTAFEKEDTILARSIFKRDEVLDSFNLAAPNALVEIVKLNPSLLKDSLFILSVIRKIERLGDHSKNIAEEIIFYVEAKILKHNKKEFPPKSK